MSRCFPYQYCRANGDAHDLPWKRNIEYLNNAQFYHLTNKQRRSFEACTFELVAGIGCCTIPCSRAMRIILIQMT